MTSDEWQPQWFQGVKEFALVVMPGRTIDRPTERLEVDGLLRAEHGMDPGGGAVRVVKDDICASDDEVEAMLVEVNGDVFIWTRNMFVWLERQKAERLRRAPRNPPRFAG